MAERRHRYDAIIEYVFLKNYAAPNRTVAFDREEFVEACRVLGMARIKNLGDIPYTYRFRRDLPEKITRTQPAGYEWLIYSTGNSSYEFRLLPVLDLTPKSSYTYIELLDATPGIITKYSLTDEQALLAILRYNRIIDIFLGITCYSLQSHLKTAVKDWGSMEIDELYIGVDTDGKNYVIPVEAKGGRDKIGRVQIDQDFAMCNAKFPGLTAIPVAAQFLGENKIALFRFEQKEGETLIAAEKHYVLLPGEK